MLKESAVAEVKQLLQEGLPYRVIAGRTGVSQGSISAIANDKRSRKRCIERLAGKGVFPSPLPPLYPPLSTLFDHPDHLDDVLAAIRAVATLFRAGARQGEAHGTEGVADVRERIRILESRLRDVLQETVSDIWTELVEEPQSLCRRAGVFG